ncbi:MAG: hypothetical protein P1V35_15430 [Planctomycetota bacterium]|nr:hypothetical protein [Planctomycetota bacterium]
MGRSEEWMIPDEVDLDDALGQAIGEAMGPERTDGDEFAAGIQERIDAEAGRMSNLSGFARAAAAFVPPILLPKAMLQGGSVLGGATLKGSGWKAAPGFAAFPALVLVMLTFSLALLVQRMVVRGPQRFERSEAQKEVITWWKRFFVPVGLVLIGLIWWGTHAPIDAVIMFVLLSMVSLVGILGSLARAGLATRREVGVRAGSFLINLMAYGYMLS